MDFYNFRLPLLILAALGCCSEGSNPLVTDKINGVVGKNVTFKTTITSGEGFVSAIWNFIKGQQSIPIFTKVLGKNPNIGLEYINRIIYNQSTCELQLGPLVKEDGGEYTFSAVTDEVEQLSGQILLVVLEPVSDVKISPNPAEPVEFNSTVILTCSAKGSFTYKWLNGSNPLVLDPRMQLTAAGSVLTIAEVRRTDLRGPIVCIAENALESGRSAPFNLTVSYGPENIVMSPPNPFLKKGSDLTLLCSAKSDPPAQLQIIFNGVALSEKFTSQLNITIPNLQEKHSGNYSCVAYNEKTKRSITSPVALVSVLESLSETNISSSSSDLIAGNSTVNLTCWSAAGRADSVEWQKDGTPLASSDRISFSADKKSLSIVQVVRGDMGEYKCQLTNKVNKDEASYKMRIKFGPENVKIAGKPAVKFEDPVELSCSADSDPPSTFTWKLNDTALNYSRAVYKIEMAKVTDSGLYTCEAFNVITGLKTQGTHKLTVNKDGKEDTGLSGGAIAGIVIGVIVAVIILACIIKRKRKAHTDVPSPY